MSPIRRHIKWIMLVSGLLTCTMVQALFAPAAALQASFGASLEGDAANLVTRNWGALIALMGVMLLYAAFHPPVRKFALVIAGLSKMVFIGLVLSIGRDLQGMALSVAAPVDAVMLVLFGWYLIETRRDAN